MIDPAKVKQGQPIKSGVFRGILEAIGGQRIYSDPGSGLIVKTTPSGTSVVLEEPPDFPIRITARDGVKYAWTAVRATAAGGWTDLARPKGTTTIDWAIESVGTVASTPQVVWARREPWTNRLIFERDLCT
jgi:hypothetical protein